MNRKITRCVAWAVFVVAMGGCCSEREAQVKDMGGRLKFGFDFAVNVKVDLSMKIAFDGNVGGWANLFAASDANLHYRFDGEQAFAQTLRADVDDDGVEETVQWLGFAEGTAQPDRVFISWKGDAYTFDSDRCYVLWWEGNRIELLNGRCGSNEAALHCTMTVGADDTSACDVCRADGTCAECQGGNVSACVQQGEQRIINNGGNTNGTGGTRDAAAEEANSDASGGGGYRDASLDTANQDGATAPEAGGQPEAGGSGGSVTVEFNTCVEQVKSLTAAANRCARAPLRETSALCQERLSDVNLCFLGVEGAGLFGSECSVLGSDVCKGIYP